MSEITDWTNPTPGTLSGVWGPVQNAIFDKIRASLQALEIALGKDPDNDEATATAAALLGAAAIRELFVVANAAKVALTVKGNADAGLFGIIPLQKWLDFLGNEVALLLNAGGFAINDWLSTYRQFGAPPNWRADIYGWMTRNGQASFVWPGPPGNLLSHEDAAQCVFDLSRANSLGTWNVPFGAGGVAVFAESVGVPNASLPTGFASNRLTADASGSLVVTTVAGLSGVPAVAGEVYSTVIYTLPEDTVRSPRVGIQFFNGASLISTLYGSTGAQSGLNQWTKLTSGGLTAPALTTRMNVVLQFQTAATGEHHRFGSAALYHSVETEYSPPAVAEPWPTFGEARAGATWQHRDTGARWLCTTGGLPSAQVWASLPNALSNSTPAAVAATGAVGTSTDSARGDHAHAGVPTSRTITAGTGLSGGGDLSANRTLAVSYGTSSTTATVGDDTRVTGAQQRSTLTTKGDLYVATASATTARQAVGTDGQVLKAASGQTNGVQWGAPLDVQTFTSSGTWTKPSGVTVVYWRLAGGGGGGGAGRRGAAASARGGGGGGGGGSFTEGWCLAAALSATETVTVGTGGAAAAAQTTNDTDGATGTNGNPTSFKSTSFAFAGGGNGGGGNNTGAPGSFGGAGQWQGGGGSGYTGAALGQTPGAVSYAAAGGGSGGGLDASNTIRAGGAGGQVYAVLGASGGTAGTSAGGTGGAGTSAPASTTMPGTGGGGGGSGTGAGGAGGAGGTYGAGGGGGGASVNGQASGAGGAGANGVVQIISY